MIEVHLHDPIVLLRIPMNSHACIKVNLLLLMYVVLHLMCSNLSFSFLM